METMEQTTNVIELEENPSSRYSGYSQDIHFSGRKMNLVVDTLIHCDLCKTPMYVSRVSVDRSLDYYQVPGGTLGLSQGTINIDVELICLKCGTRKFALAQDINFTEKDIIIKKMQEYESRVTL